MRKLLLFTWLLLPVAAGAYHFGPGQVDLRADEAARWAREAASIAAEARAIAARDGDAAARGAWAQAVEAYEHAIAELPAGHPAQSRALRLELAKARMFVSQLPEAHRDLLALVDELESDPTAEPVLLGSARAALANAQYYRTWLLRLEGAPREEWEPEIEAARQNYRLVAETAAQRGDVELAKVSEADVEASVRLARLELSDLQGLPLPSQ
ncbi:MAG: hypothetical protein JNK02_14700 [Planctomycetes bacterium]|nr:hypothetical protein [Planctomycetota bacterium]